MQHSSTPLGEVDPAPVAVIITESSVWLVDAATYTRTPKGEAPDPTRSHLSPWNRLDDGERHAHRGAWWDRDREGNLRLRILPVSGPPDGVGIVTGVVVSVTGVSERDPTRTAEVAG